jgi:hypothetical protein
VVERSCVNVAPIYRIDAQFGIRFLAGSMSAAISRGCNLRRERQLEGIASAEVRGVYKGRKASNRCREDQEDEGRRRGAVCDCEDVEDRSSFSLSRTRGVNCSGRAVHEARCLLHPEGEGKISRKACLFSAKPLTKPTAKTIPTYLLCSPSSSSD